MLFDALFYTLLVLVPVYAVLGTKNKYAIEKHLGTALMLGIFAFLFGILYGLEENIGVPQFISTQTISLQGISTSLGVFGIAISGFVVALIEYLVAGLVTWIVDETSEKISL